MAHKRSLDDNSHDAPAPKRQATLNQFILLAAPAPTATSTRAALATHLRYEQRVAVCCA